METVVPMLEESVLGQDANSAAKCQLYSCCDILRSARVLLSSHKPRSLSKHMFGNLTDRVVAPARKNLEAVLSSSQTAAKSLSTTLKPMNASEKMAQNDRLGQQLLADLIDVFTGFGSTAFESSGF